MFWIVIFYSGIWSLEWKLHFLNYIFEVYFHYSTFLNPKFIFYYYFEIDFLEHIAS